MDITLSSVPLCRSSYFQYIYPFNQADLGSDDLAYTMNIWWKPISFESEQLFFQFGTQILQLGTEEYTGKMYFTAGGLQSNNTSIISGPLNPIYPQFNQWQFLSVRKSPMVFEIFINLQLKCILDFTSGGAWPEIFPNFQIGASGSSVYTINLFRDMTFYKIKLSDSELQSVMQEIGDVKTQKLNMLRYFKLHKQLNRQIQQDYSIYGRHLRTNINCKYVTDPDMESQIQEALINKPKKYMVLTNQAATDIQISKPLHPTIFSSFSVELWIQFQSFPSSSVILRDDSPIPGNTQESDNFQIKASSNNILDVNLYTSTFLSQPSFTSSQNLYPSVGPAWRHIYLGVNTISKEIQVSLQFSMTTHSEAALTFCPLLISYWRLKPYNDYQSLEDTSLNQQFRNQASALNYVYDETFPVICTVDHIYDESTNSCITKVNSKERIFTISSSSTALVHLDTTNIGPDYLLEFWYYTKVDDFTLIEHNKFTVSLSSGTQVKLTYTSNSTTLPLAIKHDVTQWNHFLILFSSGAQDYINATFRIKFTKYYKEFFRLDLHNYVHYYKNRIYNNYELAPGLRDYLRFVKTTSALNSVDFQMHYAQKTSGTHPLQINPSATIATTRISWKDNLQECDLGYSFNGIVCKANSASIRAIQPASLQISQLNSSASPIDYFQISFHFRLTERIMSLAYSGVCIHLQSAPTYLGGKRFIEFQSSADQGFLISIAGANMVYSMTSNQYFKANHWYSFFSKYSATSSTVFRSFIAYDFRSLIGEYEQDTGNSTISLDNSINHQIYFGYANTPQTPNCDPDFSIRDFWLSQQNNLSQITLSQFLNGLRTRHQALQVSSVYLAFNESEGYLVYDYNNPNPMLNLRSGNNFIAWEWDPILFKMCDGPYEVYYQYQQYYCGVRQFMRFNKNNHQITIGDLSRGAQNQITDTYTFSITFHLRIQSDANVPQTQIFILNPTNSGGNQMIFNFNHKYLPGVYYYCQNGIDFHGYQNTVASDTDQVCSLIVNAWGLITVIKDGLTYKFYCNYYLYASYTVTNSMFPFNFDDKIKLGGSSPGYQTMNGYMRQFKYYDDLVLSTTEIINDYTLYQMVQASSSIYYSLEIHNQKYNFYLIYNKFSYMIMNEGLIRDNLIQQQDDTNYPHLVPFNSFDTTGYYYNQGSTYKWLSTTVISTLTLSGGNEWTLDMRLSLQDSLSQDLFHINGFIYLRGQSDRKLRIILGSNPTAYITKNALINLDQYQQYVFIQRIGGTGVTFILDGIIQELIPQTTSLPSTPVALKMPNNDVALKDIRIWNKAMPYNFVNQLQQKIIDGTYYPNLLYYFISRTPEHRYFFKFFRQGQYSYEYHGPYSSAPFQDSYFCLDYQVFDGYSCQTFKYVVLDSTNFKDLVLKTPQATHILTPTSVTLEFWILLHETKNAGQIVTIIDINNVAMTLQENSLFQVTVQTTGPAQIVSDRSSASSIDDFKYTYWRKVVMYDSFSETLVGTTVPIARFYMSNQPVILQNQLSYTMSKDWSIDFWVKYGQKSGCGLNSINILSQMDDGICTIGDSNAARINIMINKISGQSNQLITEDLQNGTVPQNINQYRIVSQNVYFHVAIRNSQIQVISTLNFTNPIISQSFNPLSKCSFQIGYSTLPLDSHVYFQLKNLRIWSSAMTLDQIMMWSTSTITEQGFTDLVAYYKFDNEYLIDAISGQANVQSALATFDVVADNELTMNCPIGFGFDYDKRNCYHLDHQMLFYYQDSNFTWDLQPYIQNSIKDEDLSFTAYFYIWNQHQNYTFNVIRFCNIFQLYWRYNTYTLKFSWNDASFVSLPIIQGASTTYYNWFITFNMEDKQLLIVRNADVIFDLTISQDDILQFANISDWKMTYGYVNDIDEYPIQGFKQASLFQPPLSYQETQMIHSRQQHSQFMGQYGLKQNIRSEYNYAIYNSIFKTSLYDQGMKKYITTQSGTQIDNAQESICQPGSNKIQIFCVEASSLTIQGQILSLNATSILISRQFTFTGWFYIEHHDITSSTITFAQIDSLFSLEYTSFITLKAYQALMNYDHTSLALSNKQWYYMVVSLDNLDWKVQLNEQLIIQQQGQDIDYQTTPVNEIKIGTSSLKSVISVKELKLFGHSLDILELRENMYTHTMKDSYYNQMMVYYPLAETGRNIIQDISKESRLTTIPNQQGIFWSYVPRGEISTNQNALASVSSGKNAYITKDKSLFFEKGTSAQYVLGQTILRTRFTISLFANFQDFTIFAVPQTFLSLNPGLLQIRVSSTQFRCLISDDTSSLFAINGPTNQWIGLICGISDSLKSGYFYQFQTQLIDGITIRDTFTPSPQAFQINQLTISGFDGYLKEIKIFSELIDPHVMMKYSRQVNYPDYSGVPMQFYIRINEAFGQKIYESVSQQDVAIQTSIAGVFPYWSKSSQELIICEGHSKYIMQYDYCQRAEKFAKIDPAFPFSFTIAKDEMQNSTTLVWVLFKHFGYDPISLEMSLQERFTWSIMKNKTGALLLANSSYKLYGRRDESDIISGKKWVLFINRIIYPQGVVHNYLGRPTQISQSTTDIELTGTLNTNAKLLFTNNTSGLLFQILTGTNSEIFFRNLQLWNSVFTLDVAKQRAIRGANPYRFADTLVALFRLDESGGDSLFNTASFQRESNPRLIQDPTSSGTSAGLLRWVYYKEIDANPTTDSENYKCHDDCVIDDCIGPALDECINCNQTGQQLILPDPLDCVGCSNLLCICPEDNLTACSECADPSNYYILKNQTCITGCPNNLTQFYDTQFQDCLKCHAYCLGCTGPTNAECINCKSPYLRFGSVCGSADCPTNAFFDYNIFECVTCESPCETCIGNPYNCITCIEGYAFDNDGLCTRCSDLIGFFEPWYKKYTVPGGGVCTEICGDGLDFQNYPCDDGNLNRGDGCDQNCNIERDHSCEGGNIMKPDFCFDNKGPAFSIDKISGKEGNLEFDANSAVTDILNDSGKIIVSFSQQFSILEEKTVSIEIGFKNKSAFRDENGNPLRNQISQAQYLGTYEFVNSEQEAQARQLGQTASTTSLLTMIINFVIQNLLGKALGSIWVAMNSCQIIYYMPLMAVPYPKLLKVYLKYLDFANVQDDFMGKPFFYKYLYLKQVKDEPVNESYEDYGFESSIFFFSYANKIQGWGILMCAYPLILLGSYALKFKAFDFLRRIEKSYRFNGLWRLLTELYLEMTLNAFMNIYSLQFGSKTQLTISVMALIFMGFLTYLPGFTFTIINANAHRFQQKTTEEKHGVLYEGTRIEENKSINQMYIPIFLFRRLTYVFILVLLKDYPTYQLTACVFKNFCYLMFFVTQMPFKEKMLNYQHIMNETLTGIAFAVSFVFTKTSTQHDLDFYSNMILGVVVLILGFNFLLVAFDTLKGIVELIKNFKVKVQGLKDRIKALINLLRNKKVELNETTESSQNVLQQNGYKPNINTRFDQQIQGDFETQQEDEQFHNISGQRGGHRKYERLRGQMILNSEQKMIPNSPQSVLMIQKRRKLLQQMQDGLQDGDNIISNKIGTRMRQMSANYYNNDEFYPQKDAFKDNSRVLQQKSGKLQVKLLNTKDQQLMNDYVSPQKHLNIGKDLNSTINQNNTQENLMFNIHGNHLNESKDVKDLLSEMKYDDRNNDDVSFEYLRGDLKLKRKLQNQLKNRIDMKH
eukprot:403361179